MKTKFSFHFFGKCIIIVYINKNPQKYGKNQKYVLKCIVLNFTLKGKKENGIFR